MTKRIVLLQALASTPNDLALVLEGTEPAAARRRPAADAWSIADVVNHLVDVEDRYRVRLQRVLDEERPHLPYIHPDESKHEIDTPLSDLLARFREAREATLTLLKEVQPGEWQRKGVHEKQGEVSLRYLVQYLLDHDIQHLNQVVEIQQQLRRVPPRDAQPTIEP